MMQCDPGWCNNHRQHALRHVMFYASHWRLSFLGSSPFSQWELRSSPDATFGHELSLVTCRPLRKVAPRHQNETVKTGSRLTYSTGAVLMHKSFLGWGHLILLVLGAEVVENVPPKLLLLKLFHCFFSLISFEIVSILRTKRCGRTAAEWSVQAPLADDMAWSDGGGAAGIFGCGRWFRRDVAPAGQLPATASCLGEFGITEVQSQQGEFQTECQRAVSKLQIVLDCLRHLKMNRNEWNAVAYCSSCLLHPCCFSCIVWSSLRLEKRLKSRAEVLWEVRNSCKTKALRDPVKGTVTIPGKMHEMQCTCVSSPLRASSSGKTLKLSLNNFGKSGQTFNDLLVFINSHAFYPFFAR